MNMRDPMRTIVQLVVICAFVLAGAQFTHAHELSHEDGHTHVQAEDCSDRHAGTTGSKAEGGLHCGAHMLPLIADYVLADTRATIAYTRTSHLFVRTDGPGFDTPPPRA